MQFLTLALALAGAANAHTMLSKIYINGESQGDATCIRTPMEGNTATSPVAGLTSEAMACGKDGATAVAYTCPASGNSKVTFEFRLWPDARQGGSIDGSHRGPCAVYVKKMDDMKTTSAAGAGWFKIWDQGLDDSTGKWCVDNLIANNGLLTVELPSGLPAGYYLVRPEIIALHQAVSLHDPQYYVGCAQIYIEDGPSGSLNIPSKNAVSIPGYVDGSEIGLNWNLYDSSQNPSGSYPIPGPEVYSPAGTSSDIVALAATNIEGAIPSNCLIVNGNWCGVPLESYSTQTGCWAQVDACYAQGEKCFASAPPTGAKNCEAWNSGMCKVIEASCRSGNFQGPPENQISAVTVPAPGAIPGAVNLNLLGGSSTSNTAPAPAAPAAPVAAAATSAPVEFAAAEVPVASAPSPPTDPVASAPPPPTVATTSAAAVKPSSVAVASSTAAAPAPSTSNGVKISTDGKCGGVNGQTCSGSTFGFCCSPMGTCGSSMRHCGCGCDTAFGLCLDKYQKKGNKSN